MADFIYKGFSQGGGRIPDCSMLLRFALLFCSAPATGIDRTHCGSVKLFEQQRQRNTATVSRNVHRIVMTKPGPGTCDFIFLGHKLYRRGCRLESNGMHMYTGIFLSLIHLFPPGAVPNAHVRVAVDDCGPVERRRASLAWCGALAFRGDEINTATTNDLIVPGYHESPCVMDKASGAERYSFTLFHALNRERQHGKTHWAKKKNVLIWRGSATGRRADFDPTNPRSPRLRLALLSEKHPSLIDAALNVHSNPFKSEMLTRPFLDGRPVFHEGNSSSFQRSDFEQQQYKYTIDPEGDGCSGRFLKVLSFDTVVFKYFRTGTHFLHGLLRPWRHYIPVQSNMSDLLPKLIWLQAHSGEAQRIAVRFCICTCALHLQFSHSHPSVPHFLMLVRRSCSRNELASWLQGKPRWLVSLRTGSKCSGFIQPSRPA